MELTTPHILSVIKSVKSITGVNLRPSLWETECKIKEVLASNAQKIMHAHSPVFKLCMRRIMAFNFASCPVYIKRRLVLSLSAPKILNGTMYSP